MHPNPSTGASSNETQSLTLSQADAQELKSLSNLLWGNKSSDSFSLVFKRWSQGFIFSQDEPSALIQFEGGKEQNN